MKTILGMETRRPSGDDLVGVALMTALVGAVLTGLAHYGAITGVNAVVWTAAGCTGAMCAAHGISLATQGLRSLMVIVPASMLSVLVSALVVTILH